MLQKYGMMKVQKCLRLENGITCKSKKEEFYESFQTSLFNRYGVDFASGNLIFDPEYADRNYPLSDTDYRIFVGFYCITPINRLY